MSGAVRRQTIRHAHRVVPESRNHAHRVVKPHRIRLVIAPFVARLGIVVVVTLAALAVLRPGNADTAGGNDAAGVAGLGHVDLPAAEPDTTPNPTAPAVALGPEFLDFEDGGCAVPTAEPIQTTRPGAGTAPAPVAARHPRGFAAVLGDSYSSGWNGVGEGSSSWPAIVARTQSWRVSNLAVAGTGYANPGWTSDPVRTQVEAAIRLGPGIVIVASGHNDERYAAATVNDAADVALARLRAGLPRAVIVVVGPIWPDADPDPTVVALRDHLRGTTADIGAVFIDPIEAGWFTGANHAYVGADGTHPTSAGYRHIASLLLAAFRGDARLAATPLPRIDPITTAPPSAPTPERPSSMTSATQVMACPA